MFSFTKRLEYHNLHCKFGQQNLLDYAEEIVLPALLNPNATRTTTHDTFLFSKVVMSTYFDGQVNYLGIVGRFIKSTTVGRTQVLDKNTRDVIADEQTIESAPSSVFVLLLNNHKLLYLRETPDAPGAVAFGNTMQYLVNERRNDYIREVQNASKIAAKSYKDRPALTIAQIGEQIPKATVKVVPLTNDEDVDQALDRFQIIQTVRLQFITTNDEGDPRGIFDIPALKAEAGSDTSELVHNNYKNGLSKSGTRRQINDASRTGKVSVVVQGKDASGDNLVVNDEDLKAKTPFRAQYGAPFEAGRLAFVMFTNLLKNGTLTVEEPSDESKRKIEEIRTRRSGQGDDTANNQSPAGQE